MVYFYLVIISTYLIAYFGELLYFPKTETGPNSRILTTNKNTTYLSFLFVAAIIITMSGLCLHMGDRGNYIYNYYIQDIDASLFEKIKTSFVLGNDWALNGFLIPIFKRISDSALVYTFGTAIIIYFPILYSFYKYSDNFKFAVFLFIAIGVWEGSLNGIRQYIAAAVLAMAFPLIKSRKWYLYLPLVFIMAQFHKSAYIMMAVYFIVDMPAWKRVTRYIIFGAVVLVVLYPVLGPYIQDALEGTYGNYDVVNTYGVNVFRVLVYFVPIVLSYIERKELQEKYYYYDIVVNMATINAALMLLSLRFVYYTRLCFYFGPFMIILMCWCIKNLNFGKLNKIIKALAYILFFLFYLYQMLVCRKFPFTNVGLFYWEPGARYILDTYIR